MADYAPPTPLTPAMWTATCSSADRASVETTIVAGAADLTGRCRLDDRKSAPKAEKLADKVWKAFN